MLFKSLTCWFSLGSLALTGTVPHKAEILPPSRVVARQQAPTGTKVPDRPCAHGSGFRNCWDNGFSIATDFDAKAPPAGKNVTVSHSLGDLS